MASTEVEAPAIAELDQETHGAGTTLRMYARSLPVRFFAFAAILGAELEPISFLPHPWRHVVALGLPLLVFFVSLAFWGRRAFRGRRADSPILDTRSLFFHLFSLALLAVVEFRLVESGLTAGVESALVWVRLAAIVLVVVSLAGVLLADSGLLHLGRRLGIAWAYAGLSTAAVLFSRWITQMTWGLEGSRFAYAMQYACLNGVKDLLSVFYTDVVCDPATLLIGTKKFSDNVGPGCSGIEGLMLMFAFAVGWLIFARRELRMNRAVWLVPVSLVMIWLLNIVRIAALMAIGASGHPDVAVGGFHSQAGWIFFNATALGFLMVVDRMPWFHKEAVLTKKKAETRNTAMVYLLPFLAILVATMVGRASTGGFDWLYPLRFVVAVCVLWWFRKEYRKLDWSFGWMGVLAGAAVFAMWLGLSRLHPTDGSVLAAQLSRLTTWQRVCWIAVRAIAAVVTVPIAEELAFRGYIARRVMDANVECVSFMRLSVPAILVSSILFGAMHGKMWIAGTIAGVVFAGAAKVRGRLGEAVAAHATANLLIAVWVLVSGDFGMW